MAKLSAEGKRLIYSFEGLHKALGDGRYAAYLCPAGVPTIYAGCTTGVKIGMVVTEAEGEAMFAKEMGRFEEAVTEAVTVSINQNEADALISFAYNIGVAGFKGSTLLKKLNKGDRKGAVAEFGRWNKATVKGKKVALAGLTSRRTREASLFQKPMAAPEEPAMPHVVSESADPPSRKTVAAVAVSAATGVAQFMPADPLTSVETALKTGQRVKGISDQGHGLYSWASAGVPLSALLAIAACGGFYYLICHYLPKKQETPT
ncbi:hypothetical protein DLM45_02240 [Hyphomicrobium methylovorum]|uniref:lysozyme n=1 Tax=Hyphomicrobium methylovorum TaxID=84 RepID=UPI0015E7A103|nr:lysozyme [Hyphomicrobium methylovorum]MBA2125046.1 hypothetical protein [Hyphomicrobium methylovorum]